MEKKLWAKIISLIALFWIASGFFFPIKADLSGKTVTINAYAEFYLIPIFGLWRIKTEKDTFQKKRLKWMLGMFLIFWIALPIFLRKIPVIDGSFVSLTSSYHTIGSLGFFLFFIAVLLFGKRADCGWNCTCVFTRETVGFAFRDKTLKGPIWWKLRHLKWVTFAMVWAFLILLVVDPEIANQIFKKPMYNFIFALYFGTILFIPLTGNRNICRWLCPWSATWGVLNKIGFYKITANTDKCSKCGLCEKECDMGIPIREIIFNTGKIDSTECMGCERCVRRCPKDVFKIEDFRDKIIGYNLSHVQRGFRTVIGLTLIIFLFIKTNFLGIILGCLGIALFISGMLGYCPLTALQSYNKAVKNVAK